MGSMFRAVVSTVGFEVYSWPAVAPAPSGDVYLALTDYNGDGHLARVTPSGVPVWSSKIALNYVVGVVSNATHAVFLGTSGSGTGISLRDSSGAAVWQTTLPLFTDSVKILAAAIDSSNNVALFAPNTAQTETILVLLNGTTGAITWAVNLRTDGGDAAFAPHSVSFLSGGDLIVSFLRAGGQTLQRINAADGSVVWSRNITGAGSYALVGVDGSDNIYVVGDDFGTPKRLPVMKLDASGATLWARELVQPAGLTSAGLAFDSVGGLTAGALGVFVPVSYGGATTKYCGFAFIPADGTIATGNAGITVVAQVDTFTMHAPGVAGAVGSTMAMGFQDTDGWTVLTGGPATADDGGWGPYTRTTWAGDVTAGAISASASSYTRAATGSFTATSFSPTLVAGTLTFDTYETHSVASSVPLSTAFGLPEVDNGTGVVSPWPLSTAFGTPGSAVVLTATGVASSVSFGTAAYDSTHATTAEGISPATAFGTPESERGLAPPPYVSRASAPATAFGTPAAAVAITVLASGYESALFGTPIGGVKGEASGLSAGASFGTPSLNTIVHAEGERFTTSFGTPVGGGFGNAVGFEKTAMGAPTAAARGTFIASGMAPAEFGTPSSAPRFRTRGAHFRPQFGQAQAERTAP